MFRGRRDLIGLELTLEGLNEVVTYFRREENRDSLELRRLESKTVWITDQNKIYRTNLKYGHSEKKDQDYVKLNGLFPFEFNTLQLGCGLLKRELEISVSKIRGIPRSLLRLGSEF